MGANKPKHQHYVPEFIIKNFLNEDGRVWVGDRSTGRVYCSGPANVFVKTEQYTRYTFDGGDVGKDYGYEEAIGCLESTAANVVAKMVGDARRHECPRLSEEQARTFKRFFHLQARRTRESRERVSSQRGHDEVFYEAAVSALEKGGHVPPSQEELLAEAGVREFAERTFHNVDARFSAGDHPEIRKDEASFCRETGLYVAVICLARRSFVVGSHGITIRDSRVGGGYLGGSLLPVAHDVIVQATPFPGQVRLLCLDQGSDALIRNINRAAASQGTVVAGKSERLIRSLM